MSDSISLPDRILTPSEDDKPARKPRKQLQDRREDHIDGALRNEHRFNSDDKVEASPDELRHDLGDHPAETDVRKIELESKKQDDEDVPRDIYLRQEDRRTKPKLTLDKPAVKDDSLPSDDTVLVPKTRMPFHDD
ncbi:MAG: hypothetical protein CL946_08030 [Ectothiorhodospiraceae bacterium]|nr:hypothetical protein [Ectothiorhodospiraceae bacterium]